MTPEEIQAIQADVESYLSNTEGPIIDWDQLGDFMPDLTLDELISTPPAEYPAPANPPGTPVLTPAEIQAIQESISDSYSSGEFSPIDYSNIGDFMPDLDLHELISTPPAEYPMPAFPDPVEPYADPIDDIPPDISDPIAPYIPGGPAPPPAGIPGAALSALPASGIQLPAGRGAGPGTGAPQNMNALHNYYNLFGHLGVVGPSKYNALLE